MILGFTLLNGQMMQAQQRKSISGEKKAEFSIDIFSGATSIVTGISLSNNGSYQYHYTPTFGFAGDMGYSFTSKLSLHGSLGYLQRGAEFDGAGIPGRSRYQLSYIDLWGYLEYASGGQTKFTFLAGLSQSTLFAARLTSSTGKINAMNDFKKIDAGFVAGPGILLPTTKNKIRLRFIFSYGFRDAFAEGHFNDDIKAHNHAYLVQVGYVFN